MRISIPMLVVSLLLACCSTTKNTKTLSPEIILSPSEINANPVQFDQQRVAVKGYVLLNSNGHVLYESKRLFEEYAHRLYSESDFSRDHGHEYDKYCLTIANPQKLWKSPDRYRGKEMIFRGVYIKDYMDDNSIDLGACGARPGGAIVID